MSRARAPRLLVAWALLLSACGMQGPVALRSGGGECYDGWTGELAYDSATGDITFDSGSGPVPVQWPGSYTGRWSGSQVEILDGQGRVLYRTGTAVAMMGDGYGRGVFKKCGMDLIP